MNARLLSTDSSRLYVAIDGCVTFRDTDYQTAFATLFG